MKNQVITTGTASPKIFIKALGDLSLKGQDGQEICAAFRHSDSFVMRQEDQVYVLKCLEDTELLVPPAAEIQVEKVGGDASLSGLSGGISIGSIGGSLELSQSKQVTVDKVGGNVEAAGITGQFSVQKIGGALEAVQCGSITIDKVGSNCRLEQIREAAAVRRVGGNFSGKDLLCGIEVEAGDNVDLENTPGPIRVRAGGSISVALNQPAVPPIQLRAGAEIRLRTPSDLQATLNIESRGRLIEIDLGGSLERVHQRDLQRTLGSGGAEIYASAGGSVFITDKPIPFRPFPGSIGRAIRSSVEAAARSASVSAVLSIDLSKKIQQQVQERVQAALKPLEEATGSRPAENSDPTPGPIAAEPVVEAAQPSPTSQVSNDEKLLILQMLQNKKISVDEAEQLLEALEKSGE